jgi:uncharacterized protein YyaL (SSP411 family)
VRRPAAHLRSSEGWTAGPELPTLLTFLTFLILGLGCACRRGAPPAAADGVGQGAHLVESGLPGAPPIDSALAARLRAALASKGAGYLPRTRHLLGRAPKYTNRLVLETSPYLLQHAHNPVDWHPWGNDAFEEARRRGVPIFLSVGYSTCHWCHVMEAESFEDEEIARFMNSHYVCIKVDREERPDIDAVYMSAVQSLTGSGGWPMSVWLTPERAPFFGGTYFPPRDSDRGARQGFLTLLRALDETYHRDQARITDEAETLVAGVRRDLEGRASAPAASLGATEPPNAAAIPRTVGLLKGAFDEVNGGLRGAPKFPSSLPVRLLLRYHRRTGDAEALRMATLTLEKMAAGGICDQIGGGFHRYATDATWSVPHFEKMLYDNALLAVAYLEAYQVTGRADFARVARETLDYVLREMTSPDGGFFSATDADSDGEEGKFFVWSEGEIRALLGRDADRFIRYYGVTPGGNFDGRNILHVPVPNEAERASLDDARQRLYAARARRVAPARDDKILAAWNGLMISALASGGRILSDARYTEAGRRAAELLLTKLRVGGRLMRSFKDGWAADPGYLEDYAFVAAGLFDLYETSFDARWLREALALCAETERLFADPASGGWFMTSADHEKLLARERPTVDGATPSGASVALMNALRAASFTGDDHWRAVADRALSALGASLSERPTSLTETLLALDFRTDAVREVVLVWPSQAGDGSAASAAPLLSALRRAFLPNRVLAGAAEGDGIVALAALAPIVEEKRALKGRATAYVCERGRCQLPTGDPGLLSRQLARSQPY